MRRPLLAALAICVLVCAVASAAGAATPDLPLGRGDFAGSFGIGHGRTMYLECYGRGAPTVILDSGLRNGAAVWSQRTDQTPPGATVMPAVARFTRVCGHDRPGDDPDPHRVQPQLAGAERAWRHAQTKLAALTPDAVHVIARRSPHDVMYTQPGLVIDQTRRVVRAVRRASP